MEWLWPKIKRFFSVLFSYIIALARLVVWTLVFFFSGLQRVLFTRAEIVSMNFAITPLRCDMEETGEKIAYLDKLCMDNPDLAEVIGEEEVDMPIDDINFDDTDDNGEDIL